MLDRSVMYGHDIAIAPDRDAPAAIDPKDLHVNPVSDFPFWFELMWEECPRKVKAKVGDLRKCSGLLGTNLLQYRRLTIDVVENGAVKIERLHSLDPLGHPTSRFDMPTKHRHSAKDPSLSRKLPWKEIAVIDVEGKRQTISANIDTGDDGALTLPPSHVDSFELTLPNDCVVNTINGEVDALCGDVEIVWQGCHRSAECIQREDVDRPIIGMKLLSDNRITVDFEFSGACLSITPIGRNSFADRLRQKFAWRQRWRV